MQYAHLPLYTVYNRCTVYNQTSTVYTHSHILYLRPPPKHRHPPNTTSPAPNLYNNPPTPPYSYPITYPILFSSQASYQHLSTSHKTPPNAPTKPHPYIPPPSVHRRGSNISLSIKLTSATSFDSHFKRSNCKSTLVHTRTYYFSLPLLA